MTIDEATKLLQDSGSYVRILCEVDVRTPCDSRTSVQLDGHFSINEIEALLIVLRGSAIGKPMDGQ